MMLGVSTMFCLCLLNTAIGENIAPNTTTSPSATKQTLEGLQRITQRLTSMQEVLKQIAAKQTPSSKQQTVPSSYSLVGAGSSMEFLLLKNQVQALETKLRETKLEVAETKLEVAETKLKAKEEAKAAVLKLTRSARKGGSAFVRWGRMTCTNSSQEVYCGIVGGSNHNEYGGGANELCLTLAPQQARIQVPKYYATIYGTEYEHILNHHNHDVPCCVCHVPRATTIMIPGTRVCPTGWTTQYTGHLVSGYPHHKAASQYVCLDLDPENAPGGHMNRNGNLFYYTFTVCGSLPCPPYTNKQIVVCVVCSK
ncbi:hypothetical protein ACOMHN_061741 [Nucella lapillus]